MSSRSGAEDQEDGRSTELSDGPECTEFGWRATDDPAVETREVTKSLGASLEWKSHRTLPEAMNRLVTARRPLLFEVACSPNSILTATAQRITRDDKSAARFSFFNGYDLGSGAGVRGVLRAIRSQRPSHVWFALECGPFSRMQNLNRRTAQQCADLEQKRALVMRQYVGGLAIYLECHRLGISATWEWSETCEAWRLPMVQRVMSKVQPTMCVVKGCSVGLQDSHGRLVGKGWKIATTHPVLSEWMHLPCACENSRRHVACEGKLTRESAYYTDAFAKRVVSALLHGCSHESLWNELMQPLTLSEQRLAEGKEKARTGEEVDPKTGQTGKCECMLVRHPKSEVMCAACEQAKDFETAMSVGSETQPLTDREKEEALRQIGLLHRATGHAPVAHVVRALSRKGADPRIIELARQFECPVCQEMRPRPSRRVSSLEPLAPKWSVVQADIGWWNHPHTGEKVQFTLMIDEGCRFRVAKILTKDKTEGVKSEQLMKVYQELWKPIFGVPAKLRVDPEGAWRARSLESYFETQHVELERIPAEAHWQLSHVERGIQAAKATMTKLAQDDPSVTPREALAEAIKAANEREIVRGYTPAQHALGRAPDALGRFHEAGARQVPEGLCENPEGDFKRNFERMRLAEKAFVDWTYNERIVRAQNSRGRKVEIYAPGDLVYYWRYQTKGKGKGGSFFGPARVLATETRQDDQSGPRAGSVIWVVKGDRLLKTAPEQLRRASQREEVLEELATQGPPLPWTFDRLSTGLGKQHFEDITPEVPDSEQWWEGVEQELGRPAKRLKGKQPAQGSREPLPMEVDVRDADHPADVPVDMAWLCDVPEDFQDAKAEAFWSSPGAGIELEIELPASKRGQKHMVHHFESYLVSQMRRRGIEVSERHLRPDELQSFRVAKGEEIKKFLAAKALEALPPERQPNRSTAMKMRWVLTWKKNEDTGEKKAKARCVILGYLDPMYEHRQVASPTMSRSSRQMFLAVAAAHKFRVSKGDVSGAFLQGREYSGEAYVIPTPDICAAMELPENSVTRLKRACYGLVDAPLEWFLTVRDFLLSLGFRQCVCDPCCFVLIREGRLRGMITGHVDDFMFAGITGDGLWDNKVEEIKQRFKWGEWLEDEFVQCGVKIKRLANGSFQLTQGQYIDDLREIPVCSERRRQRESATTEGEKSKMRAVLGALSWCAQQTSPHLSAAVSLFLSRVPKSSVQDVLEVNKLVFHTKANRQHKLIIHAEIEPQNMMVAAWVDASLQNREDGKSTQGLVIGITDKKIMQGSMSPVNLVHWSSTKIDRVCRSPGSAECRAAVNGEDHLVMSRLQLFELLGGRIVPDQLEQQAAKIDGVVITDSKNVFDRLKNTVFVMKGAEKRISVELMALKEAQEANKVSIRWVHSDAQLANSLTKTHEQHQLNHFYQNSGYWRIVEDKEMRSSRNRKQQGLCPLENEKVVSGDPGGMQVSLKHHAQ